MLIMSVRIKRNWHILSVLADSNNKLFDCIITHCDKEVIISIAEIFINLADKTISLSKGDLAWIESESESVEDLCLVGASRGESQTKQEEEEDILLLRAHVSIVQIGLSIALKTLNG